MHDLGVGRRSMLVRVILLAILAMGGSSCPNSWGQDAAKTIPNQQYHLAFRVYRTGDYRDALEMFEDAAHGGFVSVTGRWIDSICYHTMQGECYYHMGKLGQALQQYDAALKLYVAYKDWMLRVDFPDDIQPSDSTIRDQISWGATRRKKELGRFPREMGLLTGQLDNDQVALRGGVVTNPAIRPVSVDEIIRCTALAIRRRRDIMGTACHHLPFTQEIADAAARRSVPPNHWSEAWADALAGFAYAAAGKNPAATAALNRSLAVGGKFDHMLTGAALLELGKLALEKEQYEVAADKFQEATLASAQFGQFDDMEEAFRYGTIIHLVTGKKGVFAPLVNAAAWSKRRALPLHISIYLLACECGTHSNDPVRAESFLRQAERAIGRSQMRAGNIGARMAYQTAHVKYQMGNISGGNAALSDAMGYQRLGSRRLFQIHLADGLYKAGDVSPRVANNLFTEVLHEPTAAQWSLDPMESLSVVMSPQTEALEHWFELLLTDRKDEYAAFDIAEQFRRNRFFSTLTMGGRLVALRWILEAPKESLTKTAVLQQQDLLLKFPQYEKLSRRAEKIRQLLKDIPLNAEGIPQRKQQKLFDELAQLAKTKEAILRDIALRRQPSEFVFPPNRQLKDVQKQMPAGQLTLAVVSTRRAVYTFQVTKDRLIYNKISDPREMGQQIVTLLRSMGHHERNQALTAEQLHDTSWRQPADNIFRLLLGDYAKNEVWSQVDELVVIPDGMLWYVPFELLRRKGGSTTTTLFEEMRIRYAPTLSLSVPDNRGTRRIAKTGVVAGKLFPRDEAEVADEALREFRRAVPGTERVPEKLPVPSSLFASICDRLVVLDDVEAGNGGPYSWSPMQIDRGKLGGSLEDWFALPWNSPDQVVLPGFQSAAAQGLRKGGNGDEIFLSICGLMSTGARTVLISRWRVAGQTAQDLTREFVRELPRTSASRAWRRSVQLTRATEIEPSREPRVKSTGLEEPFAASHPFFWSGYLLADTGSAPKKSKPDDKDDLVAKGKGPRAE